MTVIDTYRTKAIVQAESARTIPHAHDKANLILKRKKEQEAKRKKEAEELRLKVLKEKHRIENAAKSKKYINIWMDKVDPLINKAIQNAGDFQNISILVKKLEIDEADILAHIAESNGYYADHPKFCDYGDYDDYGDYYSLGIHFPIKTHNTDDKNYGFYWAVVWVVVALVLILSGTALFLIQNN